MRKYIYTPAVFLFIILSSVTSYTQQYIWHALPNAPYTLSRFEDIYFINPSTGWIIRSDDSNGVQQPNLYRTTDGGDSWLNLFDPELGYPRCIGFANSNTGWLGTYFGDTTGIFKTTDGGNSWFRQLTAPRSDSIGVCGMYVLDENTVRACGKWNGPGKFYRTNDGGANWTVIDMSPYASRLIDCYFTSPDSGFVVGGIGDSLSNSKAVILFTSNGGDTWVTKLKSPNIAQWGWKIDFPSKDVGFVSLEKVTVTGGSYIFKTSDGGQTWEEKTVIPGLGLNQEGIGFVDETTGWLGGWYIGIYKTTNSGNSWFPAFDWGENVNRFRFFGDTIGYAAGQTIYKYELDTSVGIHNISSEIPTKPELSQNFPNPFNPITTIQFNILDYENTKLTIFDVLGREIAVLVDEILKPGVYYYKFDATGLHSGIYFYRIETIRYTETKKMTLLK